MQRLQDFKTKQIDIRSIMIDSLTLQDFFSAYLNKKQKTLLAHQKSRIAKLIETHLASDCNTYADILGKFDQATFN